MAELWNVWKIFTADESIKEMTENHIRIDGFIAIGFYVFYMALHFYSTGVHWLSWIAPGQLLIWFGWHVVINIMYSKYNSLAGPVIFHFFVNFGITQAVFIIT